MSSSPGCVFTSAAYPVSARSGVDVLLLCFQGFSHPMQPHREHLVDHRLLEHRLSHLAIEVAGATNVVMGWRCRWWSLHLRRGRQVERVLQDRLDTLVPAGACRQGELRRRFHPRWRVFIGQPDDAQASSIAHLRMRFIFQNPCEQPCGVEADGAGPVHHPQRRPLQMRLVALGAMLGVGHHLAAAVRTKVRSHPRTLMEDLHRGRKRAHLHQLVDQVIGNAVSLRRCGIDRKPDAPPRCRKVTLCSGQ